MDGFCQMEDPIGWHGGGKNGRRNPGKMGITDHDRPTVLTGLEPKRGEKNILVIVAHESLSLKVVLV